MNLKRGSVNLATDEFNFQTLRFFELNLKRKRTFLNILNLVTECNIKKKDCFLQKFKTSKFIFILEFTVFNNTRLNRQYTYITIDDLTDDIEDTCPNIVLSLNFLILFR